MKKEELTAIGLTEEQAERVFAMNGRDVNKAKGDAEQRETQLADLKEQLADRDRQLEALKKEDPAALQAKIAELQEQNQTAQANFEKQIADMAFSNALDEALKTAKTRDLVGLKAHLDMDGLKLNDGKILGLEEQLAKAKEEYGFLFEDESPKPTFAASTPGATEKPLDKMTYTEMTAYLQAHPGAEI